METVLTRHLITLADAYVAVTGRSVATVGERAAGDWRFFARLRRGEVDFRIRTFDRAVAWFAENWPDGHAWPATVPRPAAPVSGGTSEPGEVAPPASPGSPFSAAAALGAAVPPAPLDTG